MNITNFILSWIDHHPIIKQWLWFIGLWLFGFVTVLTLTYPFKLLIKLM